MWTCQLFLLTPHVCLLRSTFVISCWLQSSWSSWWQIWLCEGLRCASRCPTGCRSSWPGSAPSQVKRWGLPGRTGWTTTLCGCAEGCSSPPCCSPGCRKGCSRRCPHPRCWTEPCPGSGPGCSHGKRHLHRESHTTMNEPHQAVQTPCFNVFPF